MRTGLVSLLLLLLLGCPPSEEEEQRAAALLFLESNPTPSSLAVLQPGASGKLAAVEPEVTDDGRRNRLVKALVLIDDDESHALLVDVLSREPGRTTVAFSTARKYQKLSSHLELLYDRLPAGTQRQVFEDACWPAYSEDVDAVLPTCQTIWSAETAATQSQWMRLFTHAGPQDDAAPYERLAEGLASDLSDELDELVLRIAGGTAVPEQRDTLTLESRLVQRRARLEGAPSDNLSVAFDGGYVEVLPLDPDSDFGRTGARLLADLPMPCAATWGASSPGRTCTLEIRLNGSKHTPVVEVVGKEPSIPAAGDGQDAVAAADPLELLSECMQGGLTEKHAEATAPWVPRFGECRITLRSQRGESWSDLEEGRVVMTSSDLMQIGEALADSGTPAWRARLDIAGREKPPLRDLGATDLGFCMAYVRQGWTDCAHWLGLAATVDDPLDDLLRTGLRDVDPDVRSLCRAALSVSMDDESLDEASAPPPTEDPAETQEGEPSTAPVADAVEGGNP